MGAGGAQEGAGSAGATGVPAAKATVPSALIQMLQHLHPQDMAPPPPPQGHAHMGCGSSSHTHLSQQTPGQVQQRLAGAPPLAHSPQQQPDLYAAQPDTVPPGIRPHARQLCPNVPFTVTSERTGGNGHGNETGCPMCCCCICGVNFRQCRMWLTEGHCHAHEGDLWWKALRQYQGIEFLSTATQAFVRELKGDMQMYLDAKLWSLNTMVAFLRYREGEVPRAATDMIEHHFKYVTDVASSAMRSIGQHLAGSKAVSGALAILHATTVAVVFNTWRATPSPSSRQPWSQRACSMYAAILSRLEKFWLACLVRSNMTPGAQELLLRHLDVLASKACRELTEDMDGFDPGPYIAGGATPLQLTIQACERGWQHPHVVAILEGVCQDISWREMPLLQQARLLVLQSTLRWKEAFHYAMFHGHIAESLTYAVRAGNHKDILLMVKQHPAVARRSKVYAGFRV